MADKQKKENQGVHSRKLIRWQELTLALALVIALLGYAAMQTRNEQKPTGCAQLFLNGEIIAEIDLPAEDVSYLDLNETHGVPATVEISSAGVRFINVTCPDHICEKTGVIFMDGQTAVCMPNKLVLQIVEYS